MKRNSDLLMMLRNEFTRNVSYNVNSRAVILIVTTDHLEEPDTITILTFKFIKQRICCYKRLFCLHLLIQNIKVLE